MITGAAGRVGRLSVGAMNADCDVRLVDRHWPDADAADSASRATGRIQRVTAELGDPEACRSALVGATTVVHLAGNPDPSIGLADALRDHVTLTANVIAAADHGGTVRRIVFASSIHTMGRRDRDGEYPIGTEAVPAPCCEYGAAKVMSEHLLRLHAERSATAVACLRLGLTGAPPIFAHQRTQWLGDDDYAQLLRRAIDSSLPFAVYYGVSRSAAASWDLTTASHQLGWHPTEDAPAADRVAYRGPHRCLMISRP